MATDFADSSDLGGFERLVLLSVEPGANRWFGPGVPQRLGARAGLRLCLGSEAEVSQGAESQQSGGAQEQGEPPC